MNKKQRRNKQRWRAKVKYAQERRHRLEKAKAILKDGIRLESRPYKAQWSEITTDKDVSSYWTYPRRRDWDGPT